MSIEMCPESSSNIVRERIDSDIMIEIEGDNDNDNKVEVNIISQNPRYR